MQNYKKKAVQYKETTDTLKLESQAKPYWEAKSVVQIKVSLPSRGNMMDLGATFVMAPHP